MDMKHKHCRSGLPFKLHRRIGFRLMVYFILFGLWIGLFVYFFTVVVDARMIARDLGVLITDKTHGASPRKSVEPSKNPGTFHEDLDQIRKDIIKTKAGMGLHLYQLKPGGSWEEACFAGSEPCFTNVPPAESAFLSTAVKSGFTRNTNYARNASVYDVYFRIDHVEANSPTHRLLRVIINKGAIIAHFKEDRDLLIGYAVILILFSILIGGIFARKITVPLEELSDAAYRIAQGKYGYRNSIRSKDEIGFLGNTLNFMAEKVDTHIREINYREKTMEAMNRIDKTVLAELLNPRVIDLVSEIVASFLKTGVVLLAVPDSKQKAFIRSIYRHVETSGMKARTEPLPFDQMAPNDIRNKEYREFVIENGRPSLPEWLEQFVELESGTIIHAPLFSAGSYQGSCIVIDEGKAGFSAGEKEAIRMLADQVGVALQNVRVYREKEELLLDLLLALTRAIDAKSKWTGGHSERVAEYAVKLAEALSLTKSEIETIKITALLHDIGKIATPEIILDKPGKLTPEEYEVVKQHPAEGARIIGNIANYEDIVPGILHHHEHWDGSGYPAGLKGKQIPIISRVITVADVYDAIIADRPYRASMGLEKALTFMKEDTGKIFDPEIAPVFIEKVLGCLTPSPSPSNGEGS